MDRHLSPTRDVFHVEHLGPATRPRAWCAPPRMTLRRDERRPPHPRCVSRGTSRSRVSDERSLHSTSPGEGERRSRDVVGCQGRGRQTGRVLDRVRQPGGEGNFDLVTARLRAAGSAGRGCDLALVAGRCADRLGTARPGESLAGRGPGCSMPGPGGVGSRDLGRRHPGPVRGRQGASRRDRIPPTHAWGSRSQRSRSACCWLSLRVSDQRRCGHGESPKQVCAAGGTRPATRPRAWCAPPRMTLRRDERPPLPHPRCVSRGT